MKLTKKELNIIQELLLMQLEFLDKNPEDIDTYLNDLDATNKLADKIQIEIDK